MPVPTPNIVINGRFLTQLTAGVQRFAVETVKAIDKCLDDPAYASLKGHIELQAPRSARDFALSNIRLNRSGLTQGYLWEQVEFPLRTIGRLQLNLCMLGPILKKHQIIVVHDTSTKAMPQAFAKKFVMAYDFLVPNACRAADLVVSVSRFSAREIERYYGFAASRIPICYEGSDHIKSFAPDNSIIDTLGLKNRPFFLGVGINAPNKNLTGAIAALHKADLKDALLVVTGSRAVEVHDHVVSAAYDNVRTTGHISDEQLRALYEHALALVYPSFYEGFGLPPLEAMQCGCPAIVSDHEVLTEIGADATLRCGMHDVDALATAMKAIYSDPALRQKLKEAGLKHAQLYTWDRTARILLDLCREVAARRAR